MNFWNACRVHSAQCVSKIKSVISFIIPPLHRRWNVGILDSPRCLSVRPSVCRQGFRNFLKKLLAQSIPYIPGIYPYGLSLLTPIHFCVPNPNRNHCWIFLNEVVSDQSVGILSPFMGTACFSCNIWGCVWIHPTNWSDDNCQNTCTLFHYHHQIGSRPHLPLFRVRSWNSGMRWIIFYILILFSIFKFLWQCQFIITKQLNYILERCKNGFSICIFIIFFSKW